MEAKRIKERKDSILLIEKLKNDNAKMKEMVTNQENYQTQVQQQLAEYNQNVTTQRLATKQRAMTT